MMKVPNVFFHTFFVTPIIASGSFVDYLLPVDNSCHSSNHYFYVAGKTKFFYTI